MIVLLEGGCLYNLLSAMIVILPRRQGNRSLGMNGRHHVLKLANCGWEMRQVTREYSPASQSMDSSVDRAERDIVAITNSIVPEVVGSYIGFGSYRC